MKYVALKEYAHEIYCKRGDLKWLLR